MVTLDRDPLAGSFSTPTENGLVSEQLREFDKFDGALAKAGGLAALCLGDVDNLRRQSGEVILKDGRSPCFKYALLRK